MTNPTETHESVLAEMREYMAGNLHKLPTDPDDYIGDWIGRLAAAHERKVFSEVSLCTERLARAKAAEGLLREARNWIDNDTDEVAAAIARIDAHLSGAGNG